MTKRSHSITIRDVAKQADVSVATVSRYINHPNSLSKENAGRIQQVMKELNYVPLMAARQSGHTQDGDRRPAFVHGGIRLFWPPGGRPREGS